MLSAAQELTPFEHIDVSELEQQRRERIAEADAVGSVPSPATVKGFVKSGMARLHGEPPAALLDKLGERLAYERTGVRLYDALIRKFDAVAAAGGQLPMPVLANGAKGANGAGSPDAATMLQRIRAEELEHFHMLAAAIAKMGGDPTSQTPCADVTAVAASGFMQVLNDPRTTIAQSLNAMLAVELADNAGWELLAAMADRAGESQLAASFLAALAQEQVHLEVVRGWLTSLLVDDPQPSLL